VAIWEMNSTGLGLLAGGGLGNLTGWRVAGVADFNGDGKSDIL
jgi:hypothetical protein